VNITQKPGGRALEQALHQLRGFDAGHAGRRATRRAFATALRTALGARNNFTEAGALGSGEAYGSRRWRATLDSEWLALGADYGQKASMSLRHEAPLIVGGGARTGACARSMLSALERGREPAVDFLNG